MISNFFRALSRKRALSNILDTHRISTGLTRVRASFIDSKIVATSICLRFTRSELMEKILPVLNDSLGEEFNDICLERDKITVRITNFTTLKGFDLTLADFVQGPAHFGFFKTLEEANAFQITGTTGAGKTELVKRFLKSLSLREVRIFTTKPEDFEGHKFVSDYSVQNLEFIESLLERWLESDEESKQRLKTVLVFDEAYILFSGKEKRIKSFAILLNKVLAMNRAYGLRIFFLTQSLSKELLGDLNTGLISTKIVQIPDILNYTQTLGHIPASVRAQTLKTGEFLFFHRGEPVRVLKYVKGLAI